MEEAEMEKKAALKKAEKAEKQENIVVIAKRLARFSGHVGWLKYLKTMDDLKKAVAVSEASEDETSEDEAEIP